MGLDDNEDNRKKLSYIKNLLDIAEADGTVDEDEKTMIFAAATKVGVTAEEMKRIINDPRSIDFFIPTNNEERLEQVYNLVLMMMVDGEVNNEEILLCKIFAERLGYDYHIIDSLVASIKENIGKGLAREASIKSVLNEIGSN